MAESREIPPSYYVYEFSFPDGTVLDEDDGEVNLSGVVFYVGKGTLASRMDHHFREAASGCECDKCNAIRAIWDAGLVVVRRIVFETLDEVEALNHERFLINTHMGPYLTNVMGTSEMKQIWRHCKRLGINPQDAKEALLSGWLAISAHSL